MDGRERGKKKGGREKLFIPVKEGSLMERKGHFLTLPSCRLKEEKDALFPIDGLAKFATYITAAPAGTRLVGDSSDPGPCSLSLFHGKMSKKKVMQRCPAGPVLPSTGWGAP